MVELTVKSACDGLVPLRIGAMELDEGPGVSLWSIAPFKGAQADVSAALVSQFGVVFPSPGQVETNGTVECL